jgi:hypothetical protein
MNPLIKFVLIATAAVTFLLAGAGALLAYSLFHSGTVHIQIHDHSPHSTVDLDLPVPAGLLADVLDLAGVAEMADMAEVAERADQSDQGDFAADAPPFARGERSLLHFRRLHTWRPAARAACQALADGPDGLLLDVANGANGANGAETVRIRKQSGTLDIHIESLGTDVHITTPVGLLRHLANVV